MAISKKRKRKSGKKVKHDPYKAGAQESGISLQDLINILAYQEHHGIADQGITGHDTSDTRGIDFDDPDTQAVIKAVSSIDIDNPEILQDPGGKYSIDTKEQN